MQFGPLTDVYIPKVSESRRNPEYAFLTFDIEDDARALVESRKKHVVCDETVTVAFASSLTPKSESQMHHDDIFFDLVDKFMADAVNGKLPGLRVRSRHEAMDVAESSMKCWMRKYGLGDRHDDYRSSSSRESRYGDRDRYRDYDRDRYLEDRGGYPTPSLAGQRYPATQAHIPATPAHIPATPAHYPANKWHLN